MVPSSSRGLLCLLGGCRLVQPLHKRSQPDLSFSISTWYFSIMETDRVSCPRPHEPTSAELQTFLLQPPQPLPAFTELEESGPCSGLGFGSRVRRSWFVFLTRPLNFLRISSKAVPPSRHYRLTGFVCTFYCPPGGLLYVHTLALSGARGPASSLPGPSPHPPH